MRFVTLCTEAKRLIIGLAWNEAEIKNIFIVYYA